MSAMGILLGAALAVPVAILAIKGLQNPSAEFYLSGVSVHGGTAIIRLPFDHLTMWAGSRPVFQE
jgi:ABC-type cobalamin transport system permease subunit